MNVSLYNHTSLPSKQEIVSNFIAELDVKPSSRNTYTNSLKQFFYFLKREQISLPDVDRAIIIRYKQMLANAGMSPYTIGLYLSTVRKFYTWASDKGYTTNIATGIKSPKKSSKFQRQPISKEECAELLEAAASKRDYAITSLLLRTGIRTIELVRANVGDIVQKKTEQARHNVLMIQGKGADSKDRFVILSPKAHTPIQEYLKEKGKPKANEPLFTSNSKQNKGGRLTTRSVRRIVKENLISIGVNSRDITTHSLRHTTAIQLLLAGQDLNSVRNVLGHAALSTTQIYSHHIEEMQHLNNAPESALDNIF